MADNPKVLIAGAGPVGLTLANELVRHGVPVRIVDKSAARTDKSKALVLWSRTLELLDDAGYAKDFLSSGIPAHGAQISTGREIVARVSFDLVDSRFSYALMIAQSETERVLEERLAAAGVTVERTVELTGFSDKGASVEAVLTKADGARETIEAGWLVGCDGAHSTVRHGLGFAFEGSTLQSHWALADGHLEGLAPADHLHIFWHRDGILAFFPIGGDRWRVIANLGPAKDGETHPDPTLEEINMLMARRGSPGIVMSDPLWLAAFRINERKVRDYSRGRVFLAGDSAHIHSPAGGQGMNTGMQDAMNLAWKLALVSRGIATAAALLDSYDLERRPVGAQVIAASGRMTRMATLANPILEHLRDVAVHLLLGLAPVQRAMTGQMAEVSIGYPNSPLNGPSLGKTRVGSRVRPVVGEVPFGSGGTPLFAACGGVGAAELASRFPGLVEAVPRTSGAEPLVSLVRPDGYLAAQVLDADWQALVPYLQQIGAER